MRNMNCEVSSQTRYQQLLGDGMSWSAVKADRDSTSLRGLGGNRRPSPLRPSPNRRPRQTPPPPAQIGISRVFNMPSNPSSHLYTSETTGLLKQLICLDKGSCLIILKYLACLKAQICTLMTPFS